MKGLKGNELCVDVDGKRKKSCGYNLNIKFHNPVEAGKKTTFTYLVFLDLAFPVDRVVLLLAFPPAQSTDFRALDPMSGTGRKPFSALPPTCKRKTLAALTSKNGSLYLVLNIK
jgi:hypothetical protein